MGCFRFITSDQQYTNESYITYSYTMPRTVSQCIYPTVKQVEFCKGKHSCEHCTSTYYSNCEYSSSFSQMEVCEYIMYK